MNTDSINERDPELSDAISLVLRSTQTMFMDPLFKVRKSVPLFIYIYKLIFIIDINISISSTSGGIGTRFLKPSELFN